jgi:TrmH family RNA methyltransferase
MPLPEKITSAKNSRIHEVLELRERKTRSATNSIIVEGVREISRAQESKIKFKEIYFCPDFLEDEAKKLLENIIKTKMSAFDVTKEIFAKIAFGDRQEGLLAICEKPKKSFADIKMSKNPLFVVVERLEKPGNLGAILRSCDGAGVDGLILCDGRVDGYNPNVIRSSIGTVFSVNMVEASNDETLSFLKKNHVAICASLPEDKTTYTQINFKLPSAIVLGSEQEGLSDFWIKHADCKLKIPMYGKADSLNVSTTAAILIYEAIRQRNI